MAVDSVSSRPEGRPGGGTAGPRLPGWISVRPPSGAAYAELRDRLDLLGLGTVCREARCPNRPECWSAGEATIMLLGTDCTRRCTFCAVTTRWPKGLVDDSEPSRVAEAIRRSGLRYVVLTQVCRDDLPDGGAAHLARTVTEIRRAAPGTRVELLAGDLGGDPASLRALLREPPEVLGHNLETVRRLSPMVRDRRASYGASLEFLRRARALAAGRFVTKSSIMLGLGETEPELLEAFRDLRGAGVELLTLGQYLRPSERHAPVERYVPPEEFERLRGIALEEGFRGVAAGPLVRSSYRAEELFRLARSPGS